MAQRDRRPQCSSRSFVLRGRVLQREPTRARTLVYRRPSLDLRRFDLGFLVERSTNFIRNALASLASFARISFAPVILAEGMTVTVG
jgi:hypothetical protein